MTDKDTFIQNIIDSEIEYRWKLNRIAEINDSSDTESIELKRQIDSDDATFAMWMDTYNITREEIDTVRKSRIIERQDEMRHMDEVRKEALEEQARQLQQQALQTNPLLDVIPELLESDTITTV